jgi:transaldolase/glucose-6-phosphate isomerase
VDLARLLERAEAALQECGPQVPVQENPGAWLGAVLGALAKTGRDKITFVIPGEIASFGDWAEQLIAESTGKDGHGVVPVVGEPLGEPEMYGRDRVFLHVSLSGAADPADQATRLEALSAAGHPVVRLALRDAYDLGGQFYLWEMATAVAGRCLGVNPFDQPNVEAAKVCAREMMAAYARTGVLPSERPALASGGMAVYGSTAARSVAAALNEFLAEAEPGGYVALQAYVRPDPTADAALLAFRLRQRELHGLASTVGYGPRFLHSTGQLHKGDAGRGLFIQFTADDPQDAPIPYEAGSQASSMSFGVLKAAQALGDWQALLDAGRRVMRCHLGRDVPGGLRYLAERLA